MKAKIELTNPDEIEASATITMKLSEWKALRAQLSKEWPSWRLSSIICDLVHQAEAAFYAKTDVNP